ncbi:TPA: hypothetical protein MPI41_001346 [Klebsiella pneumoniae]|uniref:ead/Ea22-like family protein n=1 Tax=Klebsiella pneumoniae TaxID=573 RepID=UPI000E2C8CC1|nr:ead/Ea22-like family protein [Klebsiella pneumoniae]SWV15210.1 Ead domain protein [Klebsiella pneumoniae]HCA3729848.1 hypothetical protein [Klebsiella pneumoniae]HCA3822408.1 hypothetical protein [Klebsiella pneumoniae]HCM3206111.1 hypothetical protein [Klebsiella pneumoniae]
MTTDITELAQSLKAAAEKWQEAWGEYDKVEITIAEFIRAANQYESIVKDPANVLALVEALEKAQKRIAELENYAEAESAGADRAAEDSVYWMKRCKELESRTVKLPHRNLGHPKLFLLCPLPYYDAEDMEKALADAGIKVEAE